MTSVRPPRRARINFAPKVAAIDPKALWVIERKTRSQRSTNPRELDGARYAALLTRAHSDQAHALVATVTDMVAAHELAVGTRTKKRQKKRRHLV